ncbi:MAG: transporter substrate-binding domain-containing protein [Steroidobacteraceae bacterium]
MRGIVSLIALLCLFAGAARAADAFTLPLTQAPQQAPWRGDLDGMVERRVVRVLVPYSKTLYFVDLGGAQRGIIFDAMRAFEEQLNRKLARGELRVHAVFVPTSRAQLIPDLLAGKGDVVAADLTVTPERSRQVSFTTPAARDVREVLVTGPRSPTLRTLEDLAGQEVYVNRASSYYEHLRVLDARLRTKGLKPIRLREAPGHFETEDLLEMVNAGLVGVVVSDEYLAQLWKPVFPAMRVQSELVLNDSGDVAFAVRHGSAKLRAALDEFLKTHRQGTLFGNVTLNKYLRDTRWVRTATTKDEIAKFERLVTLFRRYGDQYDVDWLLMAAQGYQESQLDQGRRSQVGAIGVMQVMPATAKELGVGDVTQLEPNIHAGVKYIRRLVDVYLRDEGMTAIDRVLFAFASYNAGPTRVRQLRAEAKARGLDPNRWFDNVERVAAERVGRETVQYVANIYKYYIAYTLVQEEVEAGLDARR